MIELDDFNALLDLIYRASTDPARWYDIPAALERHAGIDGFWMMSGIDTVTGQLLDCSGARYAPAFMDSFRDHYAAINPWLDRVRALPTGTVVDGHELIPHDELLLTEFHSGWLLPQDDISVATGMVLHNDVNRTFVVAGNIRARDADRLAAPLRRLGELLTPHLARAFSVNRMLAARPLEMVVGAEPKPEVASRAILTLSRLGHVTACNATASALLHARKGIWQDRLGRLHCADEGAQAQLQAGLAAIAAGAYDPRDADFAIGAITDRHCVATLSPLPLHAAAHPPISSAFVAYLPVALLTIVDPWSEAHVRTRALQQAFGLSPAETELATRLVAGETLGAIADARQTTVETARSQLKALFRKTGTTRQAELVALVARFLGAPAGTAG